LRAVSSRPRRLGPRSLSPPLFLERCVRAYSGPGCCLSTSATAYDVRTKDPGLLFPRRDDGHDHLPFLRRITHDLLELPREAVTRGEPRIFVRVTVAPVPVPPTCVGLPDRDTSTTATPLQPTACTACWRVQCRLTCTGLWTERRTCPRAWRRLLGVYHEECVRLAHADDVPLLILPEDTCCHRCD